MSRLSMKMVRIVSPIACPPVGAIHSTAETLSVPKTTTSTRSRVVIAASTGPSHGDAYRTTARRATPERVADGGNGIGPGRLSLGHETLVGITRASKALGLSERVLRAAVRNGELAAYALPPGLRARVKISDLRRWLEMHRLVR